MSISAVDAATTEAERVLALGRSLDPTEWSMPSRCDGWTVADVAGHLANDCERFLEWLADAERGVLIPPFPPEHFRADNAVMLEQFTGVAGPARLSAFERAFDRWIERAAALDPQTPQRHPRGTVAVESQIWLAAGEFAIHGWDIATALGRAWDAPMAIDQIASVYAQIVAEVVAPVGDDPWPWLLRASGRIP